VDNRLLLAWYYGLRGLSLLYLPFRLRHRFLRAVVVLDIYGLTGSPGPPTVRL